MDEQNKNFIKSLSIQSFRGFKEKRTINFSYPDEQEHSGLNIIVGQNCSGKSTIIEVIQLLTKYNNNGYFLSKEMKDDKIELNIEMKCNLNTIIAKTELSSYVKVNLLGNKEKYKGNRFFVIPSRKNIKGNNLYNKKDDLEAFTNYTFNNYNSTINRRGQNQSNEFMSALTGIYSNNDRLKKFNIILNKFIEGISWNMFMSDEKEGTFIVEIKDKCGLSHFEGVGDGVITILYISIGLLLLEENLIDVLLIDEPEVSLHIELIKKISEIIREYAKKYQIIVSTHSPYMIDWESIKNGGKLIRTINEESIKTFELDNSIIENLNLQPSNNPHLYGTTAKEVFFLKDNIIIVEGQEDVVCYKKIIKTLGLNKEYNFYGWGAGGAQNISNILKILISLGYKKVVAIFDGDKTSKKESEKCEREIKAYNSNINYKIINIKQEDIRDKYITFYNKDTLEKEEEKLYKEGICDKKYEIKKNFDTDYKKDMENMFKEIDDYFEEDNK